MSRQFSLPQNFKIVQMIPPKTTNQALTSQVISLKGVNKAWIIMEFTQAAGHATTPTLNQATNIAAATNKAGPSVSIWANEDAAAGDTLVKQTAGASYAVTNNIKNKEVVFEIDPSAFDVNGGYDCAYVSIATSSQATNFVSATAILQHSYQSATPPSVVVD